MSIYCVEIGKDFGGNLQPRGLEILAKMLDGGCAWNQQDVGRALKKPSKRNLHWCGLESRGDVRQGRRLQWAEAAEWEEWHVGDGMAGKIVDQGIVGSVHQVVHVLHTDNRSDLSRLRDLRRRDVAQPDVTNQTLLLELGQNGDRPLNRALGWFTDAKRTAQVDHVEHIQTQIAKIVMNRGSQVFARESWNPGSIL